MNSKVSSKKSAIAIIQARTSSSRLPGKVLKLLAGKPMIWHIVERARACKLVSRVIVATSVEKSDDELFSYCTEQKIDCYRGSLNNVLSRYLEVMNQYPSDYIVRITGDCPLIHPDFIDHQIRALSTFNADYVRLNHDSSLLEGQGVKSSRALKFVAQDSLHPDDLEHVGSRYFAENPDKFKIVGMDLPLKWVGEKYRLTVDEVSDFELMTHIYDDLYDNYPIPIASVIEYLYKHPEVAEINAKTIHSQINQQLANVRKNSDPVLVGNYKEFGF